VLELLGIAHHFSTIVDIRATDFVSKPDPDAYRRVLERIGAQAGECILVEDNPRNLLPAKALGMATVLVDHDDCGDVHHCVSDILDVGEVVAHLLDHDPPPQPAIPARSKSHADHTEA
jgi:putative hydrolase of the HAD superfamily